MFSAYHVVDFNGSFRLVMVDFWGNTENFDQIGSVLLEVDFDGTFRLIQVYFE